MTALEFLRPKLAVPMHYNTWPVIAQDAQAFAANAAKARHTVRVMQAGESFEV